MKHGDPKIFAIEWQLNNEYSGAWLIGKVCLWVGGKRLGDWEVDTSMRDFLITLQPIVKDTGHRESAELFAMSGLEIHSTIEKAIFAHNAVVPTLEMPARFRIMLIQDNLDHIRMYFVTNGNEGKLIYCDSRIKPEVFHDVLLTRDQFERPWQECWDEINLRLDLEQDK